MPLLQFESLDMVPEGLREHAKQVDGDASKVTVNVVPQAKIDEFRDNNIKISKERDELLERIGPLQAIIGEDAEAFVASLEELRLTQQRVKDGDLKEGRALEEALTKRTEELRRSMEERIQGEGKEKAAWKSKHDALDFRFKQSLVAASVKDACIAEGAGVDPRAIRDITQRALSVFQADDHGKLTAMAGDAPIYGADGMTPMTPSEWLVKLKEEAPYFFQGSNGGGAGGDPVHKVHGRTTEQLKGMSASERLALANGEGGARL